MWIKGHEPHLPKTHVNIRKMYCMKINLLPKTSYF